MKSYLHRATQDSVFLTYGMMKIMMIIIITIIIVIIRRRIVIIIKIKHYKFFLMWKRNVFWTHFSTIKTFRTLRELQIITKICFCVRHKNRRKHNHYFNLNIYIWKSKFTSHKQYLFGLVFSGNAKKTLQSKVYYNFLYSVWKEATHIASKVAIAKNIFLQFVFSLYNLLQKKFFIPLDNWKILFWTKICFYPKVRCNYHVVQPWKQVLWNTGRDKLLPTSTTKTGNFLLFQLSLLLTCSHPHSPRQPIVNTHITDLHGSQTFIALLLFDP